MPLPTSVANSITHVALRAIKIMFAIWLLLMLISLYRDGRAHAHDAQHLSDWIGSQAYKSPNGEACCGLGDCAMLDDDAVKPVPGGYAVHGLGTYFLPYGPRDTRRERFDETVPASETLVSQDDHYWRCGSYYGGFTGPNQRRCFFIKPSFSAVALGSRGAG
jgi:hypothetical protein